MTFQHVARAVGYGVEVEVRHAVYADRVLDMALTTLSTSSFSLTNPGDSADQSLKCSGIGLRPPLSHATAMQPQYPRLSPTSPLLPSKTFARCSIFLA